MLCRYRALEELLGAGKLLTTFASVTLRSRPRLTFPFNYIMRYDININRQNVRFQIPTISQQPRGPVPRLLVKTILLQLNNGTPPHPCAPSRKPPSACDTYFLIIMACLLSLPRQFHPKLSSMCNKARTRCGSPPHKAGITRTQPALQETRRTPHGARDACVVGENPTCFVPVW